MWKKQLGVSISSSLIWYLIGEMKLLNRLLAKLEKGLVYFYWWNCVSSIFWMCIKRQDDVLEYNAIFKGYLVWK